jgi:hypothetical protein
VDRFRSDQRRHPPGIHRSELGDLQVAVDLGPRVDVSALPVERRIRHQIEIARAYSAWNRRDEALAILLDAEQDAPEQSGTTSSAGNGSCAGSASNVASPATTSLA